MTPVTDAHAHFWSPSRFDYGWISGDSPFARDFLLDDYGRASEGVPVERMVFVECDCDPRQSVAEATWVREMSDADPRIRGIVAHAELTDAVRLDGVLDALAANPLVRGVRHNIQGRPAGFCLQPAFVEGVRKAWGRGLHFELCITHDQMEDAIGLVRQCPGVRFMLDHCGKPGIQAGLTEPWASRMRELAQHPDVYCKVSGLLTEADWTAWTEEEVMGYMASAAEAFGPARIVYGSDWPVSTVAGGYAAWHRVALRFTEGWDAGRRQDFFHDNAGRFYRL